MSISELSWRTSLCSKLEKQFERRIVLAYNVASCSHLGSVSWEPGFDNLCSFRLVVLLCRLFMGIAIGLPPISLPDFLMGKPQGTPPWQLSIHWIPKRLQLASDPWRCIHCTRTHKRSRGRNLASVPALLIFSPAAYPLEGRCLVFRPDPCRTFRTEEVVVMMRCRLFRSNLGRSTVVTAGRLHCLSRSLSLTLLEVLVGAYSSDAALGQRFQLALPGPYTRLTKRIKQMAARYHV